MNVLVKLMKMWGPRGVPTPPPPVNVPVVPLPCLPVELNEKLDVGDDERS